MSKQNLVVIGGPFHGRTDEVQDVRVGMTILFRSPIEIPPRWDREPVPKIETVNHLEYSVRAYYTPGSYQHRHYIVLKSLSQSEAERLVRDYEAQEPERKGKAKKK